MLIERLPTEKLRAAIDYMNYLYDKEAWEATYELASNPEIVKSLERAEADEKAGRLKSWDDVRRDVERQFTSRRIICSKALEPDFQPHWGIIFIGENHATHIQSLSHRMRRMGGLSTTKSQVALIVLFGNPFRTQQPLSPVNEQISSLFPMSLPRKPKPSGNAMEPSAPIQIIKR